MAKREKMLCRVVAAALVALLLISVLSVGALAANRNGLSVEKLSFRDVLRLYTADRAHFGTNALDTDENGVSNAAKALSSLFTYTVGLNYTGEGPNANYFGKNITSRMGAEPYTEANLLATYAVEIYPLRGGAEPLPEGKTTRIRVYLAGYKNAVNGVEPILHYVWQDAGSWYAVKDDNPYYRVSFNGQSAAESAYAILRSHVENGTLGTWEDLSSAEGAVQLSGGTLLAGAGKRCVFAVTGDVAGVVSKGGLDSRIMALSDVVRGDTTEKTGPLVYTRECTSSGTALAVGEALRQGESYRFRVVYDEALQAVDTLGVTVRSEANGRESSVDVVWYGAQEYLTSDRYNPHAVEFTYTPNGEGQGVCSFTLRGLSGHDSNLAPAVFYACVNADNAPAAPAATAAPEEESAPATEAPAATEAPVIAETATPEPTAAPTPAPTTAATPEPAATPSAMTQATTLPLLTAAGGSAPVTRLMLAESLWVIGGRQVTGLPGVFSDLPANYEQRQAVIWASAIGMFGMEEDGSFGVNTPVTREEAAAVVYRFATLKGLNATVRGDLSQYADGASVADGNKVAVLWTLEKGLLPLRDGGLIAPDAPTLCSEVTGMIYRLENM